MRRENVESIRKHRMEETVCRFRESIDRGNGKANWKRKQRRQINEVKRRRRKVRKKKCRKKEKTRKEVSLKVK